MTLADLALVSRAVDLVAERQAGRRQLTTTERGLIAQAARICEREMANGRALPEGLRERLAGRSKV